MPGSSAAVAELKPTARSAKTNGTTAFLGRIDGRSRLARRLRDLEREHALPFGGIAACTPEQRVKLELVAMLRLRAELLRDDIAAGKPGIDEDLVRVANALRREVGALERMRARVPNVPAHGDSIVDLLRKTAIP